MWEILSNTQSCLVILNDFHSACLTGPTFLFCKMGVATLDSADLGGYVMTKRDNRHELLKVLTPGHFIVIFNRQQCGVKEKSINFGVRPIWVLSALC